VAKSTVHKPVSVLSRKRPPRVVNVLGKRIKVKIVPTLVDDQDNELLGLFCPPEACIYLATDPKHDIMQTFLHELLHAVLFVSGTAKGLTIQKEESIVTALEHGLGQLLGISH
jgi:hypothetical protein